MFPIDWSRALGQAEEFLRRHWKPKAVVEAEKRRLQRKTRDVARRIKRAVAVTGSSGAGILGYGVAIAPVSTTALLVAGTATLAAAGAMLFWPSQSAAGRKISSEELVALVAEAEEWLLQQRPKLPGTAIPAVDSIFFRLGDLNPHLAALDPISTLAWDLRRLLGDHLPRLVFSYAQLPATVRDEQPELLQRLVDGLATLDEELARICREAARSHLVTFQAQERFIETRYRDAERLRGNEEPRW
jgi:hypothetical protein